MTRQMSAVTVLVRLLGCAGGGDFEVLLPGKYFIARVSPGRYCIVAPNQHTVVLPSITGYRVDKHIVAGEAQPGLFFLLDTQTHVLVTQLPESEWLRQRAALGFHEHTLTQPHPGQTRWPRSET